MAKIGANRHTSGEISTILGADATLEGRLDVKQGVRIEGKFHGDLTSQDQVAIGPEGCVEGTVRAREVIIGGKVTGKVFCEGKVVLEENAFLQGELRTMKLVVYEGARFNGTSQMSEQPNIYQPRPINLEEEQ